MRTIGFFNNKGGVGKTSLVYHVAWMFSELNLRVIAADLDPQANLTSMFLEEDQLERIWETVPGPTIYGAVSPRFRGIGDILPPSVEEIDDNLGLLVGDLQLSRLEDALSDAWPHCANGEERSFRIMSAFSRTIAAAGTGFNADVALIDMGPNLGALNRTVLLGCDFVVVPLGTDLASLQGLRNMGSTFRDWRATWRESRARNPDPTLGLPTGDMVPAGYVVMRHSVQAGRPTQAIGRWMAEIPREYHRDILNKQSEAPERVEDDPQCLAVLKDYRSLIPLAQEARKPMFRLRPADGAFGGHQKAVQECGVEFRRLAHRILAACDIPLSRQL